MRVNFIFALGHSNKSGTYLISGGLGGLGLTVARWMVEQGVRHLVLLSRSKPAGNVQVALDAMRKTDAQVLALDVDVTKEKQVAAALAEINQSMPPLRGIIHAAGVLDDDLLLNQRRSRFVKVLSPKVAGAWNLHALTQDIQLEFFVLFSSVTSLLGSYGQGNYAAANAFLDALAAYRRHNGLPAVSINWGPWSQVGMAADSLGRGTSQIVRAGLGLIEPLHGLKTL